MLLFIGWLVRNKMIKLPRNPSWLSILLGNRDVQIEIFCPFNICTKSKRFTILWTKQNSVTGWSHDSSSRFSAYPNSVQTIQSSTMKEFKKITFAWPIENRSCVNTYKEGHIYVTLWPIIHSLSIFSLKWMHCSYVWRPQCKNMRVLWSQSSVLQFNPDISFQNSTNFHWLGICFSVIFLTFLFSDKTHKWAQNLLSKLDKKNFQ